MEWVEIFAVFVVSHLVGDYLLQTEWQATNKWAGLSAKPGASRALFSHIAGYTFSFVPAFLWLADDLGAGVLAVAALIAIPHLVQDDGRLLVGYITSVKKVRVGPGDRLFAAVDQSFHLLALFGVALVAGG